jgi:hypothetical protein
VTNDPKTPTAPAALHNARFADQQPPSEIVLSVEHAGRPEHTPDVEDLLLRVDPDSVTITREDGERFIFDRSELAKAVGA